MFVTGILHENISISDVQVYVEEMIRLHLMEFGKDTSPSMPNTNCAGHVGLAGLLSSDEASGAFGEIESPPVPL